jgi:hypothetical protein
MAIAPAQTNATLLVPVIVSLPTPLLRSQHFLGSHGGAGKTQNNRPVHRYQYIFIDIDLSPVVSLMMALSEGLHRLVMNRRLG